MLGNVFVESFNKLEDPRRDHTKKHLLLDIIALTLMATMSGALMLYRNRLCISC